MDANMFRQHMLALRNQFDQMAADAGGESVRDDPLFTQAASMLHTLWGTLPDSDKALLHDEATEFMAYINTPPSPANTPEPAAPAESTDPETEPAAEQVFFLDVPYKLRKEAQWGGSRWDDTHKSYTYTGTAIPEALAEFIPEPFSYQAWQQNELNNSWPQFEPDGEIVPRDYQETASNAIVQARKAKLPGFVIADKTGVGKTISSWDAILQMPPGNVLILCPVIVVPHWNRTIQSMGNGGHRVLVTNYEKWKKLVIEPASAKKAKKARTKNKRAATQGESKVKWDYVIADEAHYLSNPTSQRSRAAELFTQPKTFTIWASATAGSNPIELSYASRLLSKAAGSKAVPPSKHVDWCSEVGIGVTKGQYGKIVWDGKEDDLDYINRLLYQHEPPLAIRREPKDIKGWNEISRSPMPVKLNAEQMAQYELLWNVFVVEMAGVANLKKGKSAAANGLAAITRFRQKASLLRVDHIVETIREFVKAGNQVAVSVAWKETARQIEQRLAEGTKADQLTVAMIHGDIGKTDRETNRIAFQQGKHPVAVFTPTEGFSLHANETAVDGNSVDRVMLIADPRWTGREFEQIEGRTHRDGQNAPAYYLFAEGTIEKRVMLAALERMRQGGKMMGDDTAIIEAFAQVVELPQPVTEALLAA